MPLVRPLLLIAALAVLAAPLAAQPLPEDAGPSPAPEASPAPEVPSVLPSTISVSPAQPVAGRTAVISSEVPIERVVITYRPNSAIPQHDTLLVGDDLMRIVFQQAGVARVTVPGGPTTNVSVRYAQTPIAGIIVLLLAALILFGGAGYSMYKLLSEGTALSPEDLDSRPDT